MWAIMNLVYYNGLWEKNDVMAVLDFLLHPITN